MCTGLSNTLHPYILIDMARLLACATYRRPNVGRGTELVERTRQQEAICWHCLLGNVSPAGGCQLKVIHFLVALHALPRCQGRGGEDEWGIKEAITSRLGVSHL